ncbi:MAG TPA: fumarylacetoacetate hydrolase family protein [Mesorhizobium sp.]|jgi:2-keto-4-pentenoate hydratase/2-oxohepta-3-ene-1,7-dioic acid hydratase in catechol pathway|nr:fumarylacetoacetate hydrolase family protein [Mesorhizobium sp.]
MQLVTFSRRDEPGGSFLGALEGEEVADLSSLGLDMRAVARGGADVLTRLRETAQVAERVPLTEVRLQAPIQPGKVLCSGVNYKGHADENPNAKMPEEPFFFAKLPSSISGPEDPIQKPARLQQLDYEVEFAAVIGRRLYRAEESEVMPAIFGYTLLNDVSARDVQFKDNQITLGKNFSGFAPIGPCILTSDELSDPNDVRLRTRLNGRTLQDGNTSDWLFPLPRLIAFLSEVMPLEPGDIVTTGTPAGVGIFQKPPVFMWPGDVVEIEADGIGVLRNPVVEI